MSEQQGPLEELDVFNPVNFRGSGGGDQYVTYNTAQGLVIFPNGIQFGDGTVLTTADISGQDISGVANPMDSNLDANLFAINNVTNLQTSSISLNTQSGLLTEISVGAPLDMQTNDIIDAGTLTQVAGTTGNSLGETTVATNFGGASGTDTFQVQDSFSGRKVAFITYAGAGDYNGITQTGDSAIVGVQNVESTANLTLTTWSSSSAGVRITPTTTKMTGGTTTVECDGTSVVVDPSITYPDTTVQDSAFTGAGSLAGTYTSADVTIDSNGKITAISNGTASAPNIVYSAWASTLNFTSGSNQGTLVSVALTPGTWQLIGVVCVNIGGGASFNPFGNVSNPYALCSINPSGSGTIAIGTIASPNNGATWSGNSQQFYTYVQTVVTITSNTTYNLQYNVRVDLTQGFMSVPNINPPTYLRAIQLG